jgi:hypothetical protein
VLRNARISAKEQARRTTVMLLPVVFLALLALQASQGAAVPVLRDGEDLPTTLMLPTIFASQMVLARDRPFPFWGMDVPGSTVTINIGECNHWPARLSLWIAR